MPDHLTNEINVMEWLEFGHQQGWCSKIVCATHDGIPGTPQEDEEWEQGLDPCQPVVRLWNDY